MSLKRIFTLCFLLLGFTTVQAQSTINGKVSGKKGNPIPGVNIGILGSYDGGSSNKDGLYSFSTSETDSQKVKVSIIGFQPQTLTVVINKKVIELNVTLKQKISKLKAVRITAGAFEASDEKQGTSLSSLDMVTTAGSNGDNYSAMKTLPGAQQTNEREGLFVRGGTGNETQTYIDGTRVRNPFGATIPDLGSRGRFNPFIFKGTIFSTGGYSALYGQALSSAVILSTIDLPEKSSANLSLSSVGIGGGYQHLTRDKKQSFGLNYNYTNLGTYFKLIKQNVDFIQPPLSHQVDGNYRAKIGKTGMIKFYGYVNGTKTGIRRQNITSLDYDNENQEYKDEYSVKNNNAYGNLSYKTFLGDKWQLKAGYSISQNNDDISTRILTQNDALIQDANFPTNQTNITGSNFFTSSKVLLEHYLPKENAIRFGVEYIHQRDEQIIKNVIDLKEQENYTAVFAESDIYVTNNLAGKIGLRAESSQRIGKLNLAPRISAAYKLGKAGQLSGAYGLFYQNPDFSYLARNTALGTSSTVQLDYQRAEHMIVNYLYQKNKRLLRLEVYNKNYKNLIKNSALTGEPTSNGDGYARGIELFYRDKTTLKGIDYWISYSFIDSKRDFLNFPVEAQPSFVANHVANLVFKKFWTKKMFGINGTYTYSSGRPYNDLNSSEFMGGRTIDYHTVGLSCNYLKNIGKAFTVFVLSINNPFNFKQVYGYNYAQSDLNGDGQFARSEINPPARQFVFLGMFMSWGIDRSQEAINNNL
jgi:hypothetical protein